MVIQGGSVIDETGERRADVLVRDGVVSEVAPGIAAPAGAVVLDASDAVVAPGLVDLHTHLREPGGEDSETIETGARGAALGGFTAVVAMPNTHPPLDDAAVVQSVLERGRGSVCDVHAAGCITLARAGAVLAPIGEMYDLGVRLFTDDGECLSDAAVMRHALEYSTALPGAVICQHAEDPALTAGGHLHEGEWSSRLGMTGRPAEAEVTIVARDIALARRTGAHYHVQHISTSGAVDLVRRARAEGVRVTAECTPHHLVLTDAECRTFDPAFKVNPPLRQAADVSAVIEGLVEGVIDAIATDHAPHAAESKAVPFEDAPPGVLGLETALAVAMTHLVTPQRSRLAGVLGALSWRPARLAGLERHGGPVAPGRPANLCVVAPSEKWVVDSGAMASRSRNSAFHGQTLDGRVRHTVLEGEPVVMEGVAQR
ncbi:MAG: dihydroorotase [Acidimicrobiia bacterium]|nr:dihydroorotase [Acidimicrobiia bacterium]